MNRCCLWVAVLGALAGCSSATPPDYPEAYRHALQTTTAAPPPADAAD